MNVGTLFLALRLADDLSVPLARTVQTAEQAFDKLTAGPGAFGREVAKANQLVSQFSGARLIAEAERVAVAVEKIGGASKLTDGEMRQVQATVTAAIEKYAALGEDAPAHLQQLQIATRGVNDETGDERTGLIGRLFSLRKIAAAVGFAALAKEAVSFGSSLSDLSAATGVSLQALQRLKYAGDQVGVPIDTVAKSIQRLQRALIEDGAGADVIRTLGLDVERLQQSAPEAMFEAIAAAIGRIESPAERTAKAMQILGKSGGDLLPLLTSNMTDLTAGFTGMSDRAVAGLDRIDDGFARLKSGAIAAAGTIIGSIASIGEALPAAAPAAPGAPRTAPTQVRDWQDVEATVGAFTDRLIASVPAVGAYRAAVDAARPPVVDLAAATASAERGAEALRKSLEAQTKAIAAGADVLTGQKVAATIDQLAASLELAGRHGGVLASEWPKLVRQVEALAKAGLPLPATLQAVITPTRTMAALGPVLTANLADLTAGLETLNPEWQTFSRFTGLSARAADDFYAAMGRAMETIHFGRYEVIAFAGAMADTEPAARGAQAAIVEAADMSAAAWSTALGTIEGVLGSIAGAATGTAGIVTDVMRQMTQILGRAFGPNGFSGSDFAAGLATFGASFIVESIAFNRSRMQQIEALRREIMLLGAAPTGTGDGDRLERLRRQYDDLVRAAQAAEQAARDHLAAVQAESAAIDRVRALTQQYGIQFEALGTTVLETDLAKSVGQLIDAWDFLVNERFADSAAVLAGMADEAQGFIDRAQAFGITLPDTIRPLLQQMVDLGLLVDENGEKLEDLEGIRFAKSIEEGIADVTTALLDLPDRIVGAFQAAFAGIGTAATGLADDLHRTLGTVRVSGAIAIAAAPSEGPPGFAGGTGGRFVDFGRGTLAMLHGRERIMTEAEGRVAPVVHVHINAVDTDGFDRWLRRGGNRQIAKAVIDYLGPQGIA